MNTLTCMVETIEPKPVPYFPPEAWSPLWLTFEEAKVFMKRVAYYFNVHPSVFYDGSGRGSARISEIRRAVACHLRKETELSLKEITAIIGCDNHTSVIYAVKKANKQITGYAKKDKRFLTVYETVKSIPFKERKTA